MSLYALEPGDATLDIAEIIRSAPAGGINVHVKVEEVGPRHQDSIVSTQRHTTARHVFSVSLACVGVVGSLFANSAGFMTSGDTANVIIFVVCAGFGLRALEIWKRGES